MKRNICASTVFAMISALCMVSGFTVQAGPQASPFKVLGFYDVSSGDAAHDAYAKEANAWFPTVAAANGFTYESTSDWSKLNTSNLAGYKVIMFLNDLCWDGGQQTAFQTYMIGGGGWIGFHVCAYNDASGPNWPWYFTTFLGNGQFVSNTWWPTTAILDDEDTTNPITKGFPKTFVSPVNEWYSWQNDLRKNTNIKILCSIDSKSFPLGTDPNQSWTSGYYPVVWTNKNYKMVYSNMGHEYMNYSTNTATSQTFTDTQYARLILNALKYCAGMTTDINDNRQVLEQRTPIDNDLTVTAGAKLLTVSIAGAAEVRAELKDANGRVVVRSKGEAGSCLVDRAGLCAGVYFLQASGANHTIFRKILLQ
jgi:type 1 glutamine amidotransferase